ncbi:hypothetical protein MKX01_042561 [Papaver californicum]|nr:hypothetical protein MKX01_042561 [Papaver californicum]
MLLFKLLSTILLRTDSSLARTLDVEVIATEVVNYTCTTIIYGRCQTNLDCINRCRPKGYSGAYCEPEIKMNRRLFICCCLYYNLFDHTHTKSKEWGYVVFYVFKERVYSLLCSSKERRLSQFN